MAFKVNYNQQRAERNRAKQAKKDEKQRAREEEVMRRKNAGLAPLEDEMPEAAEPDSSHEGPADHASAADAPAGPPAVHPETK